MSQAHNGPAQTAFPTYFMLGSKINMFFYPVADVVPNPESGALNIEDYREGVSEEFVTADTAQDHPRLSLADRLPGGGLAKILFLVDGSPTEVSALDNVSPGASTWHGDTPNVISWHGIGSADGCANDFREYYDTQQGRYYTSNDYEPLYFGNIGGHISPEQQPHLKGDMFYTATNPSAAENSHEVVYRNGEEVYRAPWPVLCACEVQGPTFSQDGTTYLRVLCGRWDTPADTFNPISGDSAYFFEAYSLTGFYLYVESASGWEVKTVEIPEVSPGAPRVSFIAQAPHFDVTGTTVAGLVETAFGLVESINWVYKDSRVVNATQAHVFAISVASGTCSLAEPASQVTYDRDFADSTLSIYEKTEYTQTLCVFPVGGAYRKIARVDSVTKEKNISDFEKNQTPWTPWSRIYPISGSEAGAVAAMIAFFEASKTQILQCARQSFYDWAVASGYAPPTTWPDIYTSVSVWPGTNTNTQYAWTPQAGRPGDSYNAVATNYEVNLKTGAPQAPWPAYSTVLGGASGCLGIQLPNQTFYKSQKTTTSTRSSILCMGDTVGETLQVDSVETTGYTMLGAGVGPNLSTLFTWTYYAGAMVSRTFIANDMSGELRAVGANSVTGEVPPKHRVVAADLRKSAAIIKNLTTGALTFKGIPSTSF